MWAAEWRSSCRCSWRKRSRHACQFTGKGNKRHSIHARDVPVVFRHIANALTDGQRVTTKIKVENTATAGARGEKAEDGLDEGRLAGAVGTEQADGTLLELEADIAQGDLAPVGHGQVF